MVFMIFWLSTDPSIISIHPETGYINIFGRGTVNICAIESATTTCFAVSI